MRFRFKIGKKRARPLYWLFWWPLLIGRGKIARRLRLSEMSRYLLGPGDQQDRIKLFGKSYTLDPHRNSARFTLWYDPAADLWTISAYCYLNGERTWEDIMQIPKDRDFKLVLNDRIIPGKYLFIVQDIEAPLVFKTVLISKGHDRKSGFLLGPNFGESRTADRDWEIRLSKLSFPYL